MSYDNTILLMLGRSILGLYFLVPGILKIIYWHAHLELMNKHGIMLSAYGLVLAIIVEVGCGGALILNYQVFYSSLILAVLVVLINVLLHDFWSYSGIEKAHELQNFIKNIGIIGGILVLAYAGKPL